MLKTSIFIADAFVGTLALRLLRGNPAAVALLKAPREAGWMQEVASEMNLSETAFITQKDAQNFDLRWFTPCCEVDLCGHATLASAHILWENASLGRAQNARFHTRSGVFVAHHRGEQIALDFPTQETMPCESPQGLAAALGVENHQIICVQRAADDFLVEVGHENIIEPLVPDFGRLRQICVATQARGVIVTAKAESPVEVCGFDFVSRFFAPAVGVDEDPVTGSAHTKLAPFWGERFSKTELIGLQASRRGGLIEMEWHGERVEILGRATTRLRGEWLS